jgi:hypothetical protein
MILDEPSEETPESAKEHCETFFRNFFLRQSPNEHLSMGRRFMGSTGDGAALGWLRGRGIAPNVGPVFRVRL